MAAGELCGARADQHESTAADIAGRGEGDGQGKADGHGGVHGIAALVQDFEAGVCGVMMIGGNHLVPGLYRREWRQGSRWIGRKRCRGERNRLSRGTAGQKRGAKKNEQRRGRATHAWLLNVGVSPS